MTPPPSDYEMHSSDEFEDEDEDDDSDYDLDYEEIEGKVRRGKWRGPKPR